MSPILFFIIFFICTGVGKIFLQINSAAVAFIDILIAAWEGLGNVLEYPNFSYFMVSKQLRQPEDHWSHIAHMSAEDM